MSECVLSPLPVCLVVALRAAMRPNKGGRETGRAGQTDGGRELSIHKGRGKNTLRLLACDPTHTHTRQPTHSLHHTPPTSIPHPPPIPYERTNEKKKMSARRLPIRMLQTAAMRSAAPASRAVPTPRAAAAAGRTFSTAAVARSDKLFLVGFLGEGMAG